MFFSWVYYRSTAAVGSSHLDMVNRLHINSLWRNRCGVPLFSEDKGLAYDNEGLEEFYDQTGRDLSDLSHSFNCGNVVYGKHYRRH